MSQPITVVVVPVTGDIHTKTITSPAEHLDTFQSIVEGYIEAFTLPGGNSAVINEEGKLQNLPRNIRATEALRGYLFSGDYISGNLIVVGPFTEDGEVTSADLDVAQELFGPVS